MGQVILLPGTVEVSAVPEIEPDLDEICARQQELLVRWQQFGRELRRRSEHPLPLGLEIELYDMLVETDF
jgi:hypothetical protein